MDHSYSSPLARLEMCQAEGFGFGEALAVLDNLFLETADGTYGMALSGMNKMIRYGARRSLGVDVMPVPHLGSYIEVPVENAVQMKRCLQVWAMRGVMTPDVAAVFEAGSGHGQLIVSLARELGGSSTRFIGSEINGENVEVISKLSSIGGTGVDARIFDVRKPDFSFLPRGDTVFLLDGVFGRVDMDVDVITGFFDAALGHHTLKAICVFDIFTEPLKSVFPEINPLPATKDYGDGSKILKALEARRDHLTITRAVPMLTGHRKDNPLSYFEITPV